LGEADRNPDYHYNRAGLQLFCDDWAAALQSYEAAGRLDPGLPWKAGAAAAAGLLAAAEAAVRAAPPTRRAAAAAAVAAAQAGLPTGLRPVPGLPDLALGPNPGVQLACVVLCRCASPPGASAVAVAVDAGGAAFAIASAHAAEALREGALLALLQPTRRQLGEGGTCALLSPAELLVWGGSVVRWALPPPPEQERMPSVRFAAAS